MTKTLLSLIALSFISGSFIILPTAHAGEVKVTWKEPNKYRDIYAGTEGKKRFRANVFRELEKHLSNLVEVLPSTQTLEVEVTDVDLAGDVHYGGQREIRLIREIHYPRIKLSFKLLTAEKMLITSGSENLKNMNFMSSTRLKYRNKFLGYEKQLLDDWFNNVFTLYIEK